jgi:hypothetical protein
LAGVEDVMWGWRFGRPAVVRWRWMSERSESQSSFTTWLFVTCNNPKHSQAMSAHQHIKNTHTIPKPNFQPPCSLRLPPWPLQCPPSTRLPPNPSTFNTARFVSDHEIMDSKCADAQRQLLVFVVHPYGCRLLLFLLDAVITVCGGCRGGGEARDEMNTGEDGGREG